MSKNNTFFTMIQGQSATGREVIGTTAHVVPDNKIYAVTAIENDKITLTEQLPEDSEETADVIEISAANAAIAHYINNPNTRPVVDAKLVNGKLEFASTSVSYGTLPLKSVIGAVEGFVLLAADADKEGFINLFAYDVQNDKFEDLDIIVADNAKLVTFENIGTFLYFSTVLKVDVVDDKGNKTGEADVAGDCIIVPVTGGTCFDIGFDESKSYDAPIDKVEAVYQGEHGYVLVYSSKKTDENGYLVAADKTMVRVYDRLDNKLATILVDDANAKVFVGGAYGDVTTVFDKNSILIKNNRGLVIVNDADVVKAMDGYNYFCSVAGSKSDRDENITTWTFANDKHEVKSFTQTVTDRGILFAVAQ